MAIQVHAFNPIEIRLGARWQPISNQSCLSRVVNLQVYLKRFAWMTG